jgi:DeoR/GlpR family transcriptional regulator of sugar metabolism
MARTCTVLADASKFEHVATGYVFGLEEVDTVVTDGSVSPDAIDGLTRLGIRTLVAGESSVEVHEPVAVEAAAT